MGSEILEDENYPEDDFQEEESSLIFKITKAFLALVLVFGMLYFSGVREYFFFSRTSENIQLESFDPIIEGEELKLSYKVKIIREPFFGSERSKDEVYSLMSNTAAILSQAGIDLIGGEVIERELTKEELLSLLDGDFSSLKIDSGMVNIILVKNLGGLNGVAYPGRRVAMVADYTAGKDFRTLAHEIGHLLGLGHKDNSRYLMSQGATGDRLSMEEVIKMRKTLNEEF